MRTDNRQTPDLEFWLRSITDLDQQFATGELTESTYKRLRDDYTALAAEQLRDTPDPAPVAEPAPQQHPRRRASIVVAAFLAVVTIAALAVVPSAIRNRQAGQTITGNAATVASAPTLTELRAAADANPDNAAIQLGLARALLESNQLVDAMAAYDIAEQLDPNNAEPAAYQAWIMLLAGLLDESRTEAERAIAIDPTYPDAHLILTLTLRELGDTTSAMNELQAFADLTGPDHPMRPMADALADQLETGQAITPATNP